MDARFFLFIGSLFLISCNGSNPLTHPPADKLHVEWAFLGNRVEEGVSLSRFSLENQGKVALPDSGWALYFNQMGRGVVEGSESGRVRIEHLNGDWLRMVPLPGFRLESGERTEIRYRKPGRMIKESDAPAGVYFVFSGPDDDPARGFAPGSYRVLPFPGLDRFFPAGTGIPLPDAGWIFDQNRSWQGSPETDRIPVIPSAVSSRFGQDRLKIARDLTVRVEKGELTNEATYLEERLEERINGYKSTDEVNKSKDHIVIRLSIPNESGLRPEGYHLTVDGKNGITLHGADAAGIFYGIQTLLALIPGNAWTGRPDTLVLPECEVRDYPAFSYRGIMLDVARNFHRPESVRKLIRAMSAYKLNKLHLSLTNDEGWRIEIPALPELTRTGGFRGHTVDSRKLLPPAYGSGPDPDPARGLGSGFYTRDEFIELLKFAADHHVEIIPEINFPGHSRAAIYAMEARYARLMKEGREEEASKYRLADPEDRSAYLSAQNFNDNVTCVCREAPIRFFAEVTDALIGMYREAGMPLHRIHTGGDEVPAGAWTESPVCREFLESRPEIEDAAALRIYFVDRIHELLRERGVEMAGWEEVVLQRGDGGGWVPITRMKERSLVPYVWNSLGSYLDLGNRLANAGFRVVLCNVDNLYFDLAYDHHPAEPGHYWGGFVDTRRSFQFLPFEVFRSTLTDRYRTPLGNSIDFTRFEPLMPEAQKRIEGLQGQIWSETVRSPEMLEYYYLPKMLGLAERAWSGHPEWGTISDKEERTAEMFGAWAGFARAVGLREMSRLSQMEGGYHFRIPPPGGRIIGGMLHANIAFPGLEIRYTLDGSTPTRQSPLYSGPFRCDGNVVLRGFHPSGRGSRSVRVE